MATKYQILLFFIALCTWGSVAAQTHHAGAIDAEYKVLTFKF